jgi:hypothetical protein
MWPATTALRTALTDALQSEGIDVHFEDNIRFIPAKWNPVETLAVYTPALPEDHKELTWCKEKPIWLMKRAKVLGLICNEKKLYCHFGNSRKNHRKHHDCYYFEPFRKPWMRRIFWVEFPKILEAICCCLPKNSPLDCGRS